MFGIGPFPELGVKGAAIATVISRALVFIIACYVLVLRERVISFKNQSVKKIKDSLKEILHIGLPNALTKAIMPIAIGIITGLLASYGKEAVAAYGVS